METMERMSPILQTSQMRCSRCAVRCSSRRLSASKSPARDRRRSKRPSRISGDRESCSRPSKRLREYSEEERRSRDSRYRHSNLQRQNRVLETPERRNNGDTHTNNEVLLSISKILDRLSQNNSSDRINIVNVISEFNPSAKNQNINTWLTKVNEISRLHNWTDKQTVISTIPKLVGNAKRWYEGLTTVDFSWVQWQSKLKAAFPAEENYGQMIFDMIKKRARFGESLEDYFYEKVSLLNRCDIKGKRAVEYIIFGIEDRAVRLGAEAAQFNDPDKLLVYLRNIKTKQLDANTPRIRKPITNDKNDKRAPMRCYNCKQEGHSVAKCPKPVKTCAKCSLIGHNAEECFRKLDNSTKTILKISTTITNDKDKYVQKIIVNGKQQIGFVDFGSDCCLIRYTDSLSIFDKLNNENSLVMTGFGGASVQSLGNGVAEIEIQGVKASVVLHVVPDQFLKYPLLIGQTFTEKPFVNILKTDSQLIFKDVHDKLLKPFKFYLIHDVTLKPGVNYIEVRCEPETSECILVHGSFWNQPGNECFLEEGIYYPINNIFLLVFNSYAKNSFKLDKNKLIGREELVNIVFPVKPDISNVSVNKLDSLILEPFQLNDIRVGGSVSEIEQQRLLETINRYRSCFATSMRELGCTDLEKMTVDLKDDEPVVYRPYRLSHSERAEVRAMTTELLECGIIRESYSPFASPIVIVSNKTGNKRLCVDYRALNRKTVRQHYPLPVIEDQLDRLSGFKYYTSLDLASGYYQIELSENSKPETAFVTPDGQFEFNRMPFGLTNAPAVFQRVINKVLENLRFNSVIVYMDDLLIPSVSFEDGLVKLIEVFNKIKSAGLTLKLKKCNFFQNKIIFLGFEVTAEGIRPGQDKINAVENFPTPKNVHNVRQFLGLTSFFRRFIKNFALISRPLSKLLKNNTPWVWENDQCSAFLELKNKLTSRPILCMYDPKLKTELHTDASKLGIGGILFQTQPDGYLKPVSYYSRQTSPEEQHFTSYELETLAVVNSLVKFRPNLLGLQFTIVTDCNSLRSTFLKRDMITRVARWWGIIQEFNCDIVYRPGTSMSHVDALSRNPPIIDEADILQISSDWLLTVRMDDNEVQRIKSILCDSQTNNIVSIKKDFCLKRGLVYRNTEDGPRWVVPKGVKWQILCKCHDDIGHFSYEKTLEKVKADYWFPKLNKFVKKYVASCLQCARGKKPSGKKSGYLHPIPKISKPFHTLHADHLGPFNTSKKKMKYILLIIDSFTKYIVLKAVKNTKSSSTIATFKDYFALFGVPNRLITDRDSTFTSSNFKKFIFDKGVQHVLNAVATPRANGQVERYNRTVLDALTTLIQGKDEKLWDQYLPQVQWGINNTLNKTIGKTPSELLFGLRLTGEHEGAIKSAIENSDYETTNLLELRKLAADKIVTSQEQQKKRFDSKRCKPRYFTVGALVRVEREIAEKGKSRKLISKCQGPYRISKMLPNDRYEIVDTPLTKKEGKPSYTGVFSVDKIHPWLTFKNLESDSSDYIEESN